MSLNATVARVTDRIVDRSAPLRRPYLDRMRPRPRRRADAARTSPAATRRTPMRRCPTATRRCSTAESAGNLGIVTAYNDMLSAHQPYETYPGADPPRRRARSAAPPRSRAACRRCATASPRARPAWSCRLFSRDVIAMAAGIALSHNVFDSTVYLGVCDKIVPGLVIAAATFGHLPAVFLPAGPMTSGIPNDAEGQGPPAVRHRRGRPRPR